MLEIRREGRDRLEQVLDPKRRASRLRRPEEVLVENEQGDDCAVAGGIRQRRMVGKAQVLAAIPDECPQATC
jgi:hypothetical protein